MTEPSRERALLEVARGGDGAAFGRLVEPDRFDGSDNLLLRYQLGPDRR